MTVWRIFSFLILVTPLFCLILGLICWRYPPKGPTWLLGYRSRRARASQEAWQFAQNVAGQIWFGLGLVQTVVSEEPWMEAVSRSRFWWRMSWCSCL